MIVFIFIKIYKIMRVSAVALVMIVLLMTGCGGDDDKKNQFTDGSYRAEAAEFSFGWKAYMDVVIQDDEAVSISFDYLDEDGNLKSATTDEEYPMDPHPRDWQPELENQLLALDITNLTTIDGVTGATGGSALAYDLFVLVLDAAENGDTSTQILSD